jgi:hypothetical protein
MNTPKTIDTIVAFILLRFKEFPTKMELITKILNDDNIVIYYNKLHYANVANEQYGAVYTAYNEALQIIE